MKIENGVLLNISKADLDFGNAFIVPMDVRKISKRCRQSDKDCG